MMAAEKRRGILVIRCTDGFFCYNLSDIRARDFLKIEKWGRKDRSDRWDEQPSVGIPFDKYFTYFAPPL